MATLKETMVVDAPAPLALALGRPSLREVYQAHVDFAWSTLVRLGVAKSDADDATQEVFLVVHRKLASFEGRASIRSWIYGICLRVASNQRRKRRNRREDEDANDLASDLPAGALDPEEQLADHQARLVVEAALTSLAPEQQLMIVMFEIDDLTGKEIASELGLPIGTVHSRLHRARDAFRAAVERLQLAQARHERRVR